MIKMKSQKAISKSSLLADNKENLSDNAKIERKDDSDYKQQEAN